MPTDLPPRAVFLSYAREDTGAARRICDALRAFGLEVWFDQSELRGGDAWDQKIRRQIKESALFVPVISANTTARAEGYFRLEWKLAVDRSHLMADDAPFIFPVVIDDTSDAAARVPDRFRERQWMRLVGGEANKAFKDRVTALLAGEKEGAQASSLQSGPDPGWKPALRRRRFARVWWIAGATAAFAIVAAGILLRKPPTALPSTAPADAATRPAPHEETLSIAVLPFVNMSEEPGNEYFADGLAEELLNVLSKVRTLRVAARTSAFSFKGKNVAVAEIAQKLRVATILEGSVRKAGAHLRISIQLINAADGYQLWSESYDRELADIFAVQSEIAQAVVRELRSKLFGQSDDSGAIAAVRAAASQRGRNPEAYRLYLQGQFLWRQRSTDALQKSLASFQQAVALDPDYALGWAAVADGYRRLADQGILPVTEALPPARAAAERALAMQPDLPEGHAALGALKMEYDWDWKGASDSFNRALELEPTNLSALGRKGNLKQILGRLDEAAVLQRRVIELDPLSPAAHQNYGITLDRMDDLKGAAREHTTALNLGPQGVASHFELALVLIRSGQRADALRAAEDEPGEEFRLTALTVVRHALGQTAESDAALGELTKKHSEDSAFQIAEARAYRGEIGQAFEWLERAYRQRDAGLTNSRHDPLLRNLIGDSRWPVFLRKMGLADEQLK